MLKAPTYCGILGRVFLGSLYLAFYCARRLIQAQDLQDTSGDTLPPCQIHPSDQYSLMMKFSNGIVIFLQACRLLGFKM
jgi:hypothetical protein